MKKSIFTSVLLCLALTNVWALSPKAVVVNEETADLILQLKYPQGFADKKIDKAIQAEIVDIQKTSTPAPEKDSPAAPSGKSSLYIDSEIKFENKNAVSLMLSISAYTRGAAHPNNFLKTLNFINGEQLTLDQLFKADSDYLKQLALISKAAISKKKISDEKWVTEGSKPTQDNYKNWYFSQDGLVIAFDTYQVAAYVYGPQMVNIPLSEFKDWLRPEVAQAVWGN